MPSNRTATGIASDLALVGSGCPIVLVHAGIADRRMWDPQWAPLSRARPTLRLDLRGYGDSTTKPGGDQPVDHVSDILETLDEVGIRRCHLVGAFYGAGVAVEMALASPEVVESLLLCPPGGSLLAELTPDLRSFLDAERAALARDDLDTAVEVNLDWWVVGPTRERSAVAASVIETVRVMQRRVFEIQAQWGAVDTVELDPPALDRLEEIGFRTLVLSGEHDLATTKDSVSRIVTGIDDVEEVRWTAAAHLPSMEHPERFLTLLLEWTVRADRSERRRNPDDGTRGR